MRSFFNFLGELFFPPVCVSCKRLLEWRPMHEDHAVFCETCMKKWENEQLDTCGLCGERVTRCTCRTEQMEKARIDGFRKLIYYRHGTRDAVQNRLIFHIKQACTVQTTRFLAEQLASALQEMLRESGTEPSNAILTYVPRSRRARREYGVDQAENLAKALSAVSQIEVRGVILRTRGQDKQQKNLSPMARMRNAKQVFAVEEGLSLAGKTVFLIDDIVTTGASMAACARLLRRAGARAVYGLAVASDDANQSRA